jgi:hypothetical protein
LLPSDSPVILAGTGLVAFEEGYAMRAAVCLLLLLVCWPLVLEGGEKFKEKEKAKFKEDEKEKRKEKEAGLKVETGYLEKTWGIKLKSHQVVEAAKGLPKIDTPR